MSNQNFTEKCIHCDHEEKDHEEDDKGQCLICNCEGLET